MLTNTNAVHFCDIFYRLRLRALFSNCPYENQKSGHVRIIYGTFYKYFKPLRELVQAADVLQTTIVPTDRHILELSETCLYMVHLRLEPFIWKLQKQWEHRFTLKVNQNTFLLFSENCRKIFYLQSFLYIVCNVKTTDKPIKWITVIPRFNQQKFLLFIHTFSSK